MPRALVTGGAGFLGSHLCDRLLADGWSVVAFDSLLTGRRENIQGAERDPGFTFIEHDVTLQLPDVGAVDWVMHFASPASPPDYLDHPIETLRVGALGTMRALDLARECGAGFLLASTSEVYGDPAVHPQVESYWGNVNPVGLRSVYDESKRYAEALTMAYLRTYGVPAKIVRIFNTYGPRMRRDDGRAVPNFISQALNGRPMSVYGDGTQTRSLCYVDDLIEGFRRFLDVDEAGPMNLGNPEEVTILGLARLVAQTAGVPEEIEFLPPLTDDPTVRCPDVTLARAALGWEPKVTLRDGLARTVAWARDAGWRAG
ncbi:MAG TPA: UDP-glucuronic acid decarboxylase family protein [Actinomycetota bacterium]|nr:UDP-glucuronic acid decarboxylase family protein [Actinomycetota bacterium]